MGVETLSQAAEEVECHDHEVLVRSLILLCIALVRLRGDGIGSSGGSGGDGMA